MKWRMWSLNNKWIVEFTSEAQKDFDDLDGSNKLIVLKSLKKIKKNPLPVSEGGYGKPLGNKTGNNLAGLLKVKIKKQGIRIIYRLIYDKNSARIIIIGTRSDNEVYETASKRVQGEQNANQENTKTNRKRK